MSDDLVKRLRDADRYNGEHYERDPLHKEAADRIEELEAKLAKAVEALQFWSEAVEPDIDKAIALMASTLAEFTGEQP